MGYRWRDEMGIVVFDNLDLIIIQLEAGVMYMLIFDQYLFIFFIENLLGCVDLSEEELKPLLSFCSKMVMKL
ncbi:hypothetical protein L1887_21505 [Cichorium endivia]|nr:hypothetical protein L1887_21505 [Cichorium endivia]